MPSTPSRFLEIDREKHCWLKLTFTRDKYRGWGGGRVAIEDGILLRRHKSREWWGAAVYETKVRFVEIKSLWNFFTRFFTRSLSEKLLSRNTGRMGNRWMDKLEKKSEARRKLKYPFPFLFLPFQFSDEARRVIMEGRRF